LVASGCYCSGLLHCAPISFPNH